MQALFFIGIPGAGKSTFYRSRFFDTHLRINLDQLRTRTREGILLRACFESKTRFVWDNTNVSKRDREALIQTAKGVHFSVIAFYFEPDFAGSLQRNQQRIGKARVPDSAIKIMASRLEKPNWMKATKPFSQSGTWAMANFALKSGLVWYRNNGVVQKPEEREDSMVECKA